MRIHTFLNFKNIKVKSETKKRNPTLVKETLPSKKQLDVKPIDDKYIKSAFKV